MFFPWAVDNFGVWTPSSIEVFVSIARSSTVHNGLAISTAFRHLVERLSVQLYRYNAKMILRFWALHPHLEDNWLWTCADWDADCLIESHSNNDTYNTPDISCPVISDGADEQPTLGHRPATLPSSMESLVDVNDTVNALDGLGQEDVKCAEGESSQGCCPTDPPTPMESVVDDSVDDLRYAVDICNRFSLLTIETTPTEESSVEEFPTRPGSKLITKAIKSNGGLKRAVSSDDCENSASHLLVQVVHDWAKVLDSRGSSHCLFLDFAKAFDSVPHQRLLLKLECLGIHGNLLNWFRSYLTDRSQRVVINGHYSEWLPVLSGVPQGSILGPLLFILYIKNLHSLVKSSSLKIYADDVALYAAVSSYQDCVNLQDDLARIYDWSIMWQLKLSPSKCEALNITNKHSPISFT